MTNLTTVARYGLQDDTALANINIVRLLHDEYILSPTAMTADVEAVLNLLRKTPHLAATFVNAPTRLHGVAKDKLTEAMAGDATSAKDKAMRLHASAAAYAIQASRPLRPGNLFTTRVLATKDAPRNITWIADQRHAEITFAGIEVKNGASITVNVVGEDANVLWDWQKVHRPRFMKLRGIEDSPYLFPGTATPRLRSGKRALPPGSMSPAALSELWYLGDRFLGLGLTPHQCRHAVATLYLAVNPGDFATVSSILGNTEDVARRHYGKDSGEAAAKVVRAALLAHHPDIFKRMKGAC